VRVYQPQTRLQSRNRAKQTCDKTGWQPEKFAQILQICSQFYVTPTSDEMLSGALRKGADS